MPDCGQHYHCVDTSDFHGLSSLIAIGILYGALTLIEIALLVFAGSAIPYFGVITGAAFVAAVFALCAFLHGGKLICLGNNSCTIGRIMEIIPVGQDKTGFEKMDDDLTFNILLAPHAPIETKSEMIADPYQGKFLDEQNESSVHGLDFEGESVTFGGLGGHKTEVLHCEIKGCRVHDCCAVLKVMSFGAILVGAFCSIPVVGWIACAIVAAIYVAIMAAAFAIAWNATHNGHMNDVYDPAAGTLREANSNTGEGGDIVLVRGDWACDAGHAPASWNEIHPVRVVQKLTDVIHKKFSEPTKATPQLVEEFKKKVLDVWCFYSSQADDPKVKDEQGKGKNRWKIHPHVDGCKDKKEE